MFPCLAHLICCIDVRLLLCLELLNPWPQAQSITKLDCLDCGFGLYDMLPATSILADITGNNLLFCLC